MNLDYLAIDKEVVKFDPKRPQLLLRPDLGVPHETSRAAMDATPFDSMDSEQVYGR